MAPYKEIEAFIEQVHSVYPEVNIEDEARAAGVTAFCEKPLDVPHLLRVLADALKK